MYGLVQDFIDTLDVTRTDHLLPCDETYSYRNFTTSSFSLIDHFLVSQNLVSNVQKVNIIDSGCNFSDHCAITISICLNGCAANSTHKTEKSSPYAKHIKVRWDKGDKISYFYLSVHLLNSWEKIIL